MDGQKRQKIHTHAETDRHVWRGDTYTEKQRHTGTETYRDTCTLKTLRDNHRRIVKGGLSLESEPQTLAEVCRGKRKKYFEKRQRHEMSQRQGEKQKEKSTDVHRQRERAVREKYSLKDRQREVLPKGEIVEEWMDGWVQT